MYQMFAANKQDVYMNMSYVEALKDMEGYTYIFLSAMRASVRGQ